MRVLQRESDAVRIFKPAPAFSNGACIAPEGIPALARVDVSALVEASFAAGFRARHRNVRDHRRENVGERTGRRQAVGRLRRDAIARRRKMGLPRLYRFFEGWRNRFGLG